ncbi:hypothetical protein ABPG74_007570 [Tetrahymena malaccensis]
MSSNSLQIEKYKKESQDQLDLIDNQDQQNGVTQKPTINNHKTLKSNTKIDRTQSKIRIRSQIQSDESDEGFEDSQELKNSVDSGTEVKVKNTTGDELSIQNTETRGRKKQTDRLPPPPLIDQQYSLVPDMIAGWRPKFSNDKALPPPIPLSFDDENLDYIIEKLLKTQRYTVLYLGFRPKTSYDIHREFSGKPNSYNFKYGNILLQKNVLSQFNVHIETENFHQQSRDFNVSSLVYNEDLSRGRPFIGMNPQYPTNKMKFDSMFEGGNLDCVIKISENEYDLYMRVDSNTKGHLQWYNFKVFNAKKGEKVRFNIQNFTKKRSLKAYFILSFEYLFEYEDDEVQFAQIPPYTYSYLINMLKPVIYNQLNDDCKNSYLQEQTICKSLSGIPVQMLSITDYLDQSLNLSLRKVVVIIARMHPGEAPGSWMCQGLIESLLSQNTEIQQIRKKVIFKVIPMMNPDGVIIGNYRTGFAGLDLNRQFGENNLVGITNQLFPSVQALKNLIRDLKEQYGKNMLGLIDLHGHSVKKNIFTFGPYYPPTDFRYYRSKFIPKLLEKSSQYFRYHSCIYNSQKANKSTARVSFLNKYNLEICYTIEGTFGLYYNSETKTTEQMNTVDWIHFGKQLPLALKEYIEMMETYNVIKEAQDQKIQQERNTSPFKRNNNLSPIRVNSITKIKQFQTSRDILEQGDFIPFDESQVYNLGGLLKEIQNDELKINQQSDQQEEADSSDQYSDNLADSEPSDEDIPVIQRSKLFQNIDNYQKNFMKFITGKKKKEQLIIQGGEEKRDKIITHKLKRSAISEDNREQDAQKKKKKGKKKKKDQSLVIQREDFIMKDNSDIQKSMKRLDNIRQSQKKLNIQNELKYSELSSLGQYQRSLPYIEDENYEDGAQNMFLADIKKKKKARIKLKISQNNSMIESYNDSISYNPGQNLRSSYLDDEEEQIDQYKIMHLSRKYQSNQSPDQHKNRISPFKKLDNDQQQQYNDQSIQNDIDFNNQAMFYQLKNNLPHYYKRIPKNRVPLKLNIICDKFQTGAQKQTQQQTYISQQQQQQQFTQQQKQQQQQFQNSFLQEQQIQKQQLYSGEQQRYYYNLNINQNNSKYQNPNNTSTNINDEYQNPPSPIYNQKVHENLYNQIIQSAIKGNITHKNDNKQNQFNSESSSPNKPPISINELKLPIIQNKHARAFSNNQNNMSNRNSKTINIYQMPIMEQAGVDKIDFDMFKKEIMRYKRGSHYSKPQQPEQKIINSHNTYSVSPNQQRNSTHNIQQQSQITTSFPQFLN